MLVEEVPNIVPQQNQESQCKWLFKKINHLISLKIILRTINEETFIHENLLKLSEENSVLWHLSHDPHAITHSSAWQKLQPGSGGCGQGTGFCLPSALNKGLPYITRRNRTPVFPIPSNCKLKSTVERSELPFTTQSLPRGSRLYPRWGTVRLMRPWALSSRVAQRVEFPPRSEMTETTALHNPWSIA